MVTVLARSTSFHGAGDILDASIRALLLFDSESQVVAIRDMLSQSRRETYAVEWGDPVDAGPDLLRNGVHDVCVVSCTLADDALRVLRDSETAARRPPVVVLTDTGDHAAVVAANAAGATDCLDWGNLDADRLDRTLRYAVHRNRLGRRLGDALIQIADLRRSISRIANDASTG